MVAKHITCQKHNNHCNYDPIKDSEAFAYLNANKLLFFKIWIFFLHKHTALEGLYQPPRAVWSTFIMDGCTLMDFKT